MAQGKDERHNSNRRPVRTVLHEGGPSGYEEYEDGTIVDLPSELRTKNGTVPRYDYDYDHTKGKRVYRNDPSAPGLNLVKTVLHGSGPSGYEEYEDGTIVDLPKSLRS
jgi:hypothetical protein